MLLATAHHVDHSKSPDVFPTSTCLELAPHIAAVLCDARLQKMEALFFGNLLFSTHFKTNSN